MLGCFTRLRWPSSIPPRLHQSSVHSASTAAGDPSFTGFNNFNSIYDLAYNSDAQPGSSFQSLTLEDLDPISSAMASRRLFPASPGRSNSIIDSAAVFVGENKTGVAVPTYSPDPYWDFRQSMEEMVAALGVGGRGAQLDLAALHDLLLCYLSLNRKNAHKYIVTAFVDLLLTLSAATGDS